MVYGALNWRGEDEEQTVKSSTSKAAIQDQ